MAVSTSGYQAAVSTWAKLLPLPPLLRGCRHSGTRESCSEIHSGNRVLAAASPAVVAVEVAVEVEVEVAVEVEVEVEVEVVVVVVAEAEAAVAAAGAAAGVAADVAPDLLVGPECGQRRC